MRDPELTRRHDSPGHIGYRRESTPLAWSVVSLPTSPTSKPQASRSGLLVGFYLRSVPTLRAPPSLMERLRQTFFWQTGARSRCEGTSLACLYGVLLHGAHAVASSTAARGDAP